MKVISVSPTSAVVEINGRLYNVTQPDLEPVEWTADEIEKSVETHLRISKQPMQIFQPIPAGLDLVFKKQAAINLRYSIAENDWESIFRCVHGLGEEFLHQKGMWNQARQYEAAGGNVAQTYAVLRMWANDILKKIEKH